MNMKPSAHKNVHKKRESPRFIKPLSDEDLKTLIEKQKNVNGKLDVNKWHEQRGDIPEIQTMDSY